MPAKKTKNKKANSKLSQKKKNQTKAFLQNKLTAARKSIINNSSLWLVVVGSAMAILAAALLGFLIAQALDAFYPALESTQITTQRRQHLAKSMNDLRLRIADVEDDQARFGMELVNDEEMQARITTTTREIMIGDPDTATMNLQKFNKMINQWDGQLASKRAESAVLAISQPANDFIELPILMYHKTPPNFEEQMQVLKQRGYTTINLDEAARGLKGQALPSKPVVITFDDGFSNQQEAADILQKHQLKATFYIVNGGAESHYCIGANRQAEKNCGDSYLSWGQIRQLDRNPLFTIGSHTLDHEDLSKLSLPAQRNQILRSKAELESQLGHKIYHFAYPYGSFNADTIHVVAGAGFHTAVTTIPGELQPRNSPFTLRRIRSTDQLR